MSFSTIGDTLVAARVEETIKRRGADTTAVSFVWTSLAAAGGVLAGVAMFITWYSADFTANALNAGVLPPLGLFLIMVASLILIGKQLGLFGADRRVDADLFTFFLLGGGALAMVFTQATRGTMHDLAYLLLIPVAIGAYLLRVTSGRGRSARLELEQVALGLATVGTALLIVKRLLDADNATGGWAWGLLAGIAVCAAALAACQYLGILSFFQVVLFAALAASVTILVVLLVQVVGDGWPVLSGRLGDFWSGTLRSRSSDDRLGISQGITGSFWIAAFVVFISFPIGIAAAVYLEEYAPRDVATFKDVRRADNHTGGLWANRWALRQWLLSRLTGALDIIVRNLAGVPSVVYGLLGLFLFVDRGQTSLFAGGMTLAILVLPIIVITAAEAVRAVPQSLRQGAYGVGATKWEVIRSQVLPFAAPGILTGTLLALARAVGEAAPLILVGAITGRLAPRDSMFSSFDGFFGQFTDRFTAMPIIIVGWVRESGKDAGFAPAAGAAIVILLVFVILMNSVAVLLRNHFEKKRA